MNNLWGVLVFHQKSKGTSKRVEIMKKTAFYEWDYFIDSGLVYKTNLEI
jgi:hypothetical protein